MLILEIWTEFGPVAQLGARFNRTEEAEGSNPSRSIKSREASDGQTAGADRVVFIKLIPGP